MSGPLEGKVAVVTGGAGGIGFATTRRLAQDGAHVIVAERDPTQVEAAAKEIGAAGLPDAIGVMCDVSDEAQVAAVASDAVRRFGRLDIVVNNAGVMHFRPFAELTTDDWMLTLKVDLLGAFYFMREVFRRGQTAAIVNVASVHALRTSALVAPYATAKAALVALTRSASIEGKPLGIRVNAVLPGAIDTPMLWNNPNVQSGAEKIDRADVAAPEDIASVIAFLASDDARFITGEALVADGGRMARL